MLKFSPANVKIQALKAVPALAKFLQGKRKVYSLDLISGYSCPHAHECLSKVIVTNGKKSIKDGANTKFRCFSASQEVIFPAVYNNRKHNFETLKKADFAGMVKLLSDSMPQNLGVCRIHVAGDFFNQNYLDAWIEIARQNPTRLFYAYTKSLNFWIKRKNSIPENFVLTASHGGRLDDMIASEGLRSAKVVYSEDEAANAGLAIDHTDEHAANPETASKSFALMIHGIQPKGGKASAAIKLLKKNGVKFSYGPKSKEV